MKNSRGFTLIELLAVIIIMGILLLVAIPAVTKYIADSRKKAYIASASNYIDGARLAVNNMELTVSDPDTTYYIPIKCIDLEKGKGKSPYGDWEDAFVVVVINGQNYEYYWASRDIKGYGVTLTYEKELKPTSVKNLKSKILPNNGIGDKSTITVLNNCTMEDADITANEGTIAAYIKSGLVLHYDGINNSGSGHNSSAMLWTDLSGNGNNMTINGDIFWGSNYLYTGATTATKNSNNPLKDQSLSNQSYTVEIVFSYDRYTGDTRRIAGINSGFIIEVLSTSSGRPKCGLHYINSGVNDLYAYTKDIIPLGEAISISGTYFKNISNNVVKMYTNATDVATNQGMNQLPLLERAPAGMSTSLNYGSMVETRIYSIRIYDRELTSTEILANFNVDKKRFGI